MSRFSVTSGSESKGRMSAGVFSPGAEGSQGSALGGPYTCAGGASVAPTRGPRAMEAACAKAFASSAAPSNTALRTGPRAAAQSERAKRTPARWHRRGPHRPGGRPPQSPPPPARARRCCRSRRRWSRRRRGRSPAPWACRRHRRAGRTRARARPPIPVPCVSRCSWVASRRSYALNLSPRGARRMPPAEEGVAHAGVGGAGELGLDARQLAGRDVGLAQGLVALRPALDPTPVLHAAVVDHDLEDLSLAVGALHDGYGRLVRRFVRHCSVVLLALSSVRRPPVW